ncbi:MAG: hypothetical protein L0Z73_04995 [Gammaproteobacteria bacterium]|nr:hypothetical protein [Gammaproteobacteria bacterium]
MLRLEWKFTINLSDSIGYFIDTYHKQNRAPAVIACTEKASVDVKQRSDEMHMKKYGRCEQQGMTGSIRQQLVRFVFSGHRLGAVWNQGDIGDQHCCGD